MTEKTVKKKGPGRKRTDKKPVGKTEIKFQDLMPSGKNLGDKTCYCGTSDELNYYLMLEHLKTNKEWYENNSLYRDISFSHNLLRRYEIKKSYFHDFIINSKFPFFEYNYKAVQTLDAMSGYENVVIGDCFTMSPMTTFEALNDIKDIVRRIVSNGQRIYYLIPDIIFEPGNTTYTANSPANSKMTYRMVAYARYFDQFMQFIRDFEKLPIYRIVIPNSRSFFKVIPFVKPDTLDVAKMATLKNDREDLGYISRPFLTIDKIAEALHLIHLDSQPQDYIISSDTSFCEYEIYNSQHNPEKITEIKLDNSFLESKCFQNYSRGYYLTRFEEMRMVEVVKKRRNSYKKYVQENYL